MLATWDSYFKFIPVLNKTSLHEKMKTIKLEVRVFSSEILSEHTLRKHIDTPLLLSRRNVTEVETKPEVRCLQHGF